MNPSKITSQRAKAAKVARWIDTQIAANNPDVINFLSDLEGILAVTWQVLLDDKNISEFDDPIDGRRAGAIRFLRAILKAGVCGR